LEEDEEPHADRIAAAATTANSACARARERQPRTTRT
jgi:hypothetical protein